MRPIRIHEFFYHVLVSGFFSYVTFAHNFPSIQILTETPLGQHKFLTIHCLYFQVLYYGFATLADLKYFLIGTSNNSYGTRKIRDYLFLSIIFPITCTVCIQFWGVYWYDPTLACKLPDPKYLSQSQDRTLAIVRPKFQHALSTFFWRSR